MTGMTEMLEGLRPVCLEPFEVTMRYVFFFPFIFYYTTDYLNINYLSTMTSTKTVTVITWKVEGSRLACLEFLEICLYVFFFYVFTVLMA